MNILIRYMGAKEFEKQRPRTCSEN